MLLETVSLGAMNVRDIPTGRLVSATKRFVERLWMVLNHFSLAVSSLAGSARRIDSPNSVRLALAGAR